MISITRDTPTSRMGRCALRPSVEFLGGEKLALDKVRVEKLLQDYFALRGWGDHARVTTETMERLRVEAWKSS